jgi:hypothetical protein
LRALSLARFGSKMVWASIMAQATLMRRSGPLSGERQRLLVGGLAHAVPLLCGNLGAPQLAGL